MAGRVVWVVGLSLVLGSCSSSSSHPVGSGKRSAESPDAVTVQVEAGQATTARLPGVEVTLPAGAAEPGSTLTVTPDAADVSGLPDFVKPAGPAVAVDLSSGEPTKPASVSFARPDDSTNTTTGAGTGSRRELRYVVVWQDGDGGWRWLPTTTRAGRVVARTDHFSFGFLAKIDVRAWIGQRVKDLTNYFTGRSGLPNPDCGEEKNVNGVKVTSDGGDAVKWCYGNQDGRRVLKVSNNTRTFLQVTYPTGWNVVDGAAVSMSVDTVSRALGAAVSSSPEVASRIVDGGDTLTLSMAANASGHVNATVSSLAWTVSAISFGVGTFRAVAGAAGSALGQEAGGAADRVAAFLGGRTGALDGWAEFRSCIGGVAGSVDLNPNTGASVSKILWSCLPGLMATQVKNVHIFAAGLVIKMVSAAVGAILTGVNLLVSRLREIWDTIASFAGRSDPDYDIWVRAPVRVFASPQPAAAFFTPSGNIACVLGTIRDYDFRGVECQINQASYRPPKAPAWCHTDYGSTLLVDAFGGHGALIGCVGDTMHGFAELPSPTPSYGPKFVGWRKLPDVRWVPTLSGGPGTPQYAALGYGQGLRAGDYECDVTEDGVTCGNLKTKASFFQSRDAYRIRNP